MLFSCKGSIKMMEILEWDTILDWCLKWGKRRLFAIICHGVARKLRTLYWNKRAIFSICYKNIK